MLHTEAVSPSTFELLNKVSSIPELENFNLAGGTALALQIGHRISFDLDFFGRQNFTTEEIIEALTLPLTIISQSKNILILNIQNVKVDFVNYRYPLLEEPLLAGNVRLLKPQDIAAMKMAAIAGRGRKRDFFDLYFLCEHFTLRQMLDFYNQKYDDGSELMVAKSLTYFDDAEEDEDPKLLKTSISWKKVKSVIIDQVQKQFS